jgi:8-oxo-dGTP diphosphatase
MKDLPRISVGLVVWRADEVLLIRRANPPYQGCWSIPGGKVEFGETLHEAALRELKEETGIEAAIEGLIDVFESITEHGHYVMGRLQRALARRRAPSRR